MSVRTEIDKFHAKNPNVSYNDLKGGRVLIFPKQFIKYKGKDWFDNDVIPGDIVLCAYKSSFCRGICVGFLPSGSIRIIRWRNSDEFLEMPDEWYNGTQTYPSFVKLEFKNNSFFEGA